MKTFVIRVTNLPWGSFDISQQRAYVFPSNAEFIQVSDTRGVVTTPTGEKTLTGGTVKHMSEVFRLLRDGLTQATLARETDLTDAQVGELLTYLEAEGIIVEDNGQFEGDIVDWLAPSPSHAREALDEKTVAVTSTQESKSFDWLSRYCEVEYVDEPDRVLSAVDVVVTIAENERPDWHHSYLERAFDADAALLPGRAVGKTLRIGPLTRPNVTACYHCFYQRWLASSDLPSAARRQLETREQPRETTSLPPFVFQQLETFLAQEVLLYLLDGKVPASAGTFVEFDIESCATKHSDVLKLPGCEVCGTS